MSGLAVALRFRELEIGLVTAFMTFAAPAPAATQPDLQGIAKRYQEYFAAKNYAAALAEA